jgi:hypothetical protein
MQGRNAVVQSPHQMVEKDLANMFTTIHQVNSNLKGTWLRGK